MNGSFLYELSQRGRSLTSPLQRHQYAMHLWEFGLRMLANVCITHYRYSGEESKEISESLKFLARPSSGHWWLFVREIAHHLAGKQRPEFESLQQNVFAKNHDELFAAIELETYLKSTLSGESRKPRRSVRIDRLFDLMIQYRNSQAHGFLGGKEESEYSRAATLIDEGVSEIWSTLDIFLGRRLTYVERVELRSGGAIEILSWDLSEPKKRAQTHQAHLSRLDGEAPIAGRLYLDDLNGNPDRWLMLHPFATYDLEKDELLLLGNASPDSSTIAYIGCKSGDRVEEVDDQTHRQLLTQLVRTDVSPEVLERWKAESQADAQRYVPTVSGGRRRTIGEYELCAVIGSGAFGTVYAARQVTTNKMVALKRLSNSGDKNRRTRFKREVEALRRVKHPHLIDILDAGIEQDEVFYVMDLINGADLGTLLELSSSTEASTVDSDSWKNAVSSACELSQSRHEVLTDPDGSDIEIREQVRRGGGSRFMRDGHVKHVAEMGKVTADALQALHDQGVVHRDVKPGNIMVTENGEAILMDLGLARIEDAQTITMAADKVGTIRYMSPEQLYDPTKVEARSDIYSLGATLWELLTFRPFLGITNDLPIAEQHARIRRTDPESIRKYNRSVPKDLEKVVTKCVDKDETRRYRRMSELIDDLNRWLSGEPVHAQDPSPYYLLVKIVGRNKQLAAAVAALLLAILLTTAFWFYRVNASNKRALAYAEALKGELYNNSISLAQKEIQNNHDFDRAARRLEDCPEELRGWEWNYLIRRLDGPNPPLAGHTRGLWSAEFSPDGDSVVTASIDGNVGLWDLAANTSRLKNAIPAARLESGVSIPLGEVKRVFDQYGKTLPPIMRATYSPDGKYIASASFSVRIKMSSFLPEPDLRNSTGVVTLWDASSLEPVASYDKHPGVVMSVAFSPDGNQVVSSTIEPQNTFHLWDRSSQETIHVFEGHRGIVHRVAFTPDSAHLVSVDSFGDIKIWSGKSYDCLFTLNGHNAPIIDVSVSPDGTMFATASQDGKIGLWEMPSGEPILSLKGHLGAALGIDFSPDGTMLCSAGFDKTVRVWDTESGSLKITLRGHTDVVWTVQFDQTGTKILSASFDKTARIWDGGKRESRDTPHLFELTGHQNKPNSIRLSPDGRYWATSSWDHTVKLWDAQNGELVHTFSDFDLAVWGVEFQPNSSLLAAVSWDGSVKVFDCDSKATVHEINSHTAAVHGVAFSRDGSLLATAGFDGQIFVWDTATWEMINVCDSSITPIYCVEFSADGRIVFSGGTDRKIHAWSVKTGKSLGTLGEHDAVVHDLEMSADGSKLYSGSWDGTVLIWEMPDDGWKGAQIARIDAHEEPVNCIRLSPDQQIIATGSDDKSVRFWDATTGAPSPQPTLFHRGAVWSIDYSDEDSQIATAAWTSQTGVQIRARRK